jgi:hypothetical protein
MEQAAPETAPGRGHGPHVRELPQHFLANHGKPWDGKAMGTKVSTDFIASGYYVSPAAGNFQQSVRKDGHAKSGS